MLAMVILFAATSRWLWAVPLIVSISFVYAATRHEESWAILEHAIRFGAWITGFMLLLFMVFYVATEWWAG